MPQLPTRFEFHTSAEVAEETLEALAACVRGHSDGSEERERARPMKYYLSGPMRGIPGHNYQTFLEVEEALKSAMAEWAPEVLNPARNFAGDTTHNTNEYMELDLRMVLEADVIVFLPGWENSEGASRERQLGQWTGKQFMVATQQGADEEWTFYPTEFLDLKASPRESALEEAKQFVTGDRNSQYGPPTQDFRRSADAMTAYGYRHTQLRAAAPPCPTCGAKPLAGHDTAILVDTVKTSRLMWNPTKRDSWVDKAGYSGCGYECAVEEAKAA